MARKEQLSYLLVQKLAEQYANGKGQSKAKYKQETLRLREIEKQKEKKGLEHEDYKKIDTARELIFSETTFREYKKWAKNFCKYIKENYGVSRISIAESVQYIQPYINYLTEKNYSPWTINLATSAMCKATSQPISSFSHPKRDTKIVRSSSEKGAVHDKSNERNPIYIANTILGLRRSSLAILKAGDITEIRNEKDELVRVEVQVKGKGGRINISNFYPEYPEEVEFVLALKEGKRPEEKIFDKSKFRDIDFHSARSIRARELYNRCVDEIENNPSRKEWYINEIERIYERDGKEQKEDYDRPIMVRGKHKQHLIEQGLDTEYSRIGCLFATCNLAHNRSSVSSYFYIQKP